MSAANRTTVAFFPPGARRTVTAEIFQYATGQVLRIEGLDLPNTFHVDFSNYETRESSKPKIGSGSVVDIPGEYLRTGLPVYAFIVLSEGPEDSATEYMVQIPVRRRPQPTDEEPDPEQQSVIDELIAELNAGVETAEACAEEAGGHADDAGASAKLAESWAVGGTGTRPGEDQDNAKHYAELAAMGAEESGYAWFDVNDADGKMYVYISDNLSEDVHFAVNEAAGILEVTYE